MRSSKQILVENTAWVYVAKLFGQLMSLVASVLVLRHLDVSTYGTYVFLFGLFTAYQLLITSPLRHVLVRFIPEFRSRLSNKYLIRMVLLYGFIAIVMVVAFTGIGLVFRRSLADFFNISDFDSYLPSFLFFVLSYALKILLEIVLSALLLHRPLSIINLLVASTRAVLYLILLKVLDVNLLLQIEGAVSLLFVLGSSIVLYKGLRLPVGGTASLKLADKKRIQRFWFLSLFTEFGACMIGRTSDYYIVAALSNPYYIGLYGFAVKLYDMLYKVLPIRELESVLKPLFFGRFTSSSSDEALNSFYNFSIKALLPLLLFPVLYFFIFGKVLILEVFGVKYIEAYWTSVIILSGLLMDGLFFPLIMLIQLKEKLQVVLLSRVVVVFSIVAGVFFMKYFGIVGVAIATLSGELLKNVFMYYLFRPYCKIKYNRKGLSAYAVIAFVLLLLFMPWQSFFNGVYLWVFGSVLYALVFTVLILNFHPFKTSEVNELKELVQSNRRIAYLLKPIGLIGNKMIFYRRRNE